MQERDETVRSIGDVLNNPEVVGLFVVGGVCLSALIAVIVLAVIFSGNRMQARINALRGDVDIRVQPDNAGTRDDDHKPDPKQPDGQATSPAE